MDDAPAVRVAQRVGRFLGNLGLRRDDRQGIRVAPGVRATGVGDAALEERKAPQGLTTATRTALTLQRRSRSVRLSA